MIVFAAMRSHYEGEDLLGVFTTPEAARAVEGCDSVCACKVDAKKQPFYLVRIDDDDAASAYENSAIPDGNVLSVDDGYPVTASFSEFNAGRRSFTACVMAESEAEAIDKARSLREQMLDEEDHDEVERRRALSVRVHEQRQIERSKRFFRDYDLQQYTAQRNDAGEWYVADEIGTKVSDFMTEEEARALTQPRA